MEPVSFLEWVLELAHLLTTGERRPNVLVPFSKVAAVQAQATMQLGHHASVIHQGGEFPWITDDAATQLMALAKAEKAHRKHLGVDF
ncbi:hypothetical protein [Deinococcus cavernae]|uniref:hypothetical protein n=1 Tax=Deinococcus cavernae TaxID=2320857 RepID=UPI0011C2191B|nr:hypothetical protein [Deinococcus cavernae]